MISHGVDFGIESFLLGVIPGRQLCLLSQRLRLLLQSWPLSRHLWLTSSPGCSCFCLPGPQLQLSGPQNQLGAGQRGRVGRHQLLDSRLWLLLLCLTLLDITTTKLPPGIGPSKLLSLCEANQHTPQVRPEREIKLYILYCPHKLYTITCHKLDMFLLEGEGNLASKLEYFFYHKPKNAA